MVASASEECDHVRAMRPTSPKDDPEFFTLPLEIRLRIYEALLVCNYGGCIDEHWWLRRIGTPEQGFVFLNRPWLNKSLGPSILRSCKQVYREAIPVLYSKNVFFFRNPGDMLSLVTQAGPSNLAMIQSLVISVSAHDNTDDWKHLFEILAQKATSLRYMRVDWNASLERRSRDEAAVAVRGMGKNVTFVRALANIQGLKKLAVEGYHAVNWPAYLERTMNVPVDVSTSFERFLVEKCTTASEERLNSVRRNQKGTQQRLTWYQRGTEDLWP